GAYEEVTGLIEEYASSIVEGASVCGFGLVDNLDVLHRLFVVSQAAFGNSGEVATLRSLRKHPVHHPVVREIRVEGEPQEPALLSRVHFRQSGYRLALGAVGRHDPHGACLLVDKKATVGKLDDTPRLIKAVGHDPCLIGRGGL